MTAPRYWQTRGIYACLLWPLSMLFLFLSCVRRAAYRYGWLKSWRSPVPVVIVGNITVGGAGKTPLVVALVEHLRSRGVVVGVVTRGYKGASTNTPQLVTADSDVVQVGDEAVLLARQLNAPLAAGVDRSAAVQLLLANHPCALVICDDGLQHYALQRDMEIAVVAAGAGVGNGFCLPAGPLREPLSRLQSVDLVIYSGDSRCQPGYQLQAEPYLMSVCQADQRRALDSLRGATVRAIAGIARPDNFFKLLQQHGLDVKTRAFPDHHAFTKADMPADSLPVLMTEKDAVKCTGFELENAWYVRVKARVDEQILNQFDHLLCQLPVNQT